MKKLLLSILGIIALILGIGWLATTFFPHKLVPMMLDQQIKRLNRGGDLLKETENITVYTIGTSSPMPGT